jgi:hypothetical protein
MKEEYQFTITTRTLRKAVRYARLFNGTTWEVPNKGFAVAFDVSGREEAESIGKMIDRMERIPELKQ